MLEKLMPKSDEFFDDFDAQCRATVKGAELLHALLSDYREVPVKVAAIKAVEHEGDAVTHTAFKRLNKQFITPFDRTQIHRLLSRIDDVLDLTDSAASRLAYYEVTESRPDAVELARVLVASTKKVQEVVGLLRLIKQPEQILTGCREIKKFESEADDLHRIGVGRLFKSGADALTVIKWKEILDLIETATDKCLDVANVIESVVLEHS